LSLGSWRTFERIPREEALAVMQAAREQGFNFLDDARYDDETGTAPIPSGYSEVLFGELFRAAGWDREDTVVSNKLWWEFWPEQSAAAELDASLGRMGFDYVDLIYANPPPPGLDVADLVAAVGELVASGKARAWGLVNWTADDTRRAVEAAAGLGIAPPCAAQLPYSLVHRSWVEDPAMTEALSAPGVGGIIASFSLAGGVLSGKYRSGNGAGRAAGRAEAEASGPGSRRATADSREPERVRSARPRPAAPSSRRSSGSRSERDRAARECCDTPGGRSRARDRRAGGAGA